MRLYIDGTETVKQLERGDRFALEQDRCQDCGSGPDAGANRHFPEPLFKGEIPDTAHPAVSVNESHVHSGCVSRAKTADDKSSVGMDKSEVRGHDGQWEAREVESDIQHAVHDERR